MDLTELRNRVLRKLEDLAINVDDVDYDLNMVQRQYIQPYARVPGGAEYTTMEDNETVELSDIAPDIYRINYIADTSNGRNIPVHLVSDFSVGQSGARVCGDKLNLNGIGEGRTVKVAYWKKLRELGVGDEVQFTIVPDIPEQWHDLYVSGAVAMVVPDFLPIFHSQHQGFKMDRLSETRPLGARMKIKGWW